MMTNKTFSLKNLFYFSKRFVHFSLNFRVIPFLVVFFFIFQKSPAQEADFSQKIRIALWAELDAYPESKEAQDFNAGQFDFPINRLKATSLFLLNGMVYGWNFTYTPSDKLRDVKEYFELEEIGTISPQNQNPEIIYSKPWIEDNKLNVWVEFARTPQMMWNYNMWRRIKHQKIKGYGKGKISAGFEGITDAASDAVKNAIRTYYRSIIKNKPKEIKGRVIICRSPLLGLNAGHYTLELDFFLETDKITTYTQF